MTIKTLPLLYFFVAVLLFATCIREIDYKNDEVDRNALVVSGGFYEGSGPFFLRLSRPTNYEKRDFEPVAGARIWLNEDDASMYPYEETSATEQPGVYRLSNVTGVPGHTYSILIQLSDGTGYKSKPQMMPAALPIDSAEMRFAFVEDITGTGDVTRVPFAQLYAHATLPADTKDRFLRWEAESIFIFNEPFTGDPFDHPKQCFITNGMSAQVIAITNPAALLPGTQLVEYTGRRRIDFSFEYRNCLSIYQRTTGKDAYEYWQRIQELVEPTGTIFDPPPAPVRGNVENISDPQYPAYGFFEVASSDTARVYVNRGDLPFDVVAFVPKYCNAAPGAGPKPECDDCLLFQNSTVQKPDWWQ